MVHVRGAGEGVMRKQPCSLHGMCVCVCVEGEGVLSQAGKYGRGEGMRQYVDSHSKPAPLPPPPPVRPVRMVWCGVS